MKYNQALYGSAARTATPTAPEVSDGQVLGVQIVINVTAVSATPSVVPTIEGKDPVTGNFYVILTGAAVTATGTTILRVHPQIPAAANLTAQDFLPKIYRVVMTHADADSITYSVTVNSTT